jgi:acetyltransferase-like isoleucine patch superfamily enzyme
MDLMSKLRTFLHMPFQNKVNVVNRLKRLLMGRFFYRRIFGSFGNGSILYKPTLLSNPQCMHIGDNTLIRQGARFEAVILHPITPPTLHIGNDVNIEQNVHIVCHHRILIGNRVSITANCSIVDTTHPFDDLPANIKVGATVQDDDGFVEIGEGSFLGIGCVVLPNVRIGKGCVIGANSVVTRSLPDYCVAAGIPARVIRAVRRIQSRASR